MLSPGLGCYCEVISFLLVSKQTLNCTWAAEQMSSGGVCVYARVCACWGRTVKAHDEAVTVWWPWCWLNSIYTFQVEFGRLGRAVGCSDRHVCTASVTAVTHCKQVGARFSFIVTTRASANEIKSCYGLRSRFETSLLPFLCSVFLLFRELNHLDCVHIPFSGRPVSIASTAEPWTLDVTDCQSSVSGGRRRLSTAPTITPFSLFMVRRRFNHQKCLRLKTKQNERGKKKENVRRCFLIWVQWWWCCL